MLGNTHTHILSLEADKFYMFDPIIKAFMCV